MASKADLVSAIEGRFGLAFQIQRRPAPESLSAGIPEVDALTRGLPRGCITEICGPVSSGRTSLLDSILAAATAREEFCALVDPLDSFDPLSAARAGVDLDRLLWIRCGQTERALQALDWLVQGGGFGVVALDLGDVAAVTARRISLTSWFRLRRAIENTFTALIVIEREPLAGTCASLVLELKQRRIQWSGMAGTAARLMGGSEYVVSVRKPVRPETASFQAQAVQWPDKRRSA